MRSEVVTATKAFELPGPVAEIAPGPLGHINAGYRVRCTGPDGPALYMLQRINTAVFRRPVEMMENMARVTEHLRARLTAVGVTEVDRRVIRLVRVKGGGWLHRDGAGECWRMYHFIPGRVEECVETPAQAETAGRAFGAFTRLLADLPPPRLHETIAGFHDTPLRVEAVERAIAADACGRVRDVREEIGFLRARRPLAGALLELHRAGQLPERVVHNDAKLSNVVLDERTGDALAVVDLDTVMPGLALYDFGDMVRSMTCRAAEDEPDATRVECDVALFGGLVRGYLAEMGPLLTPAERCNLVTAGQVITLEQAARFLADYLCGDTYYRTSRVGQNLDRARVQLALLESLERRSAELTAQTRRIAEGRGEEQIVGRCRFE